MRDSSSGKDQDCKSLRGKPKMPFKIKYLVVPVIVISILTLGAGCIATPNFSSSFASLPVVPQSSSDVSTLSSSSYSPAIADLIDRVRPAVVVVDAKFDTSGADSSQPDQLIGTGWIINQSGFIVTNSHVVNNASSVTVTFSNGQTYTANEIQTDPVADLAVIDIGISNLIGIKIGDSSNIKVDDKVIALGNANGDGIVATQGTISSTSSTLTVENRETLHDMLETTAFITYGDSGGPLINTDGEVMGIVTGALMNRLGSEVNGYAINIDNATPIIQKLIQDCSKNQLGVITPTP